MKYAFLTILLIGLVQASEEFEHDEYQTILKELYDEELYIEYDEEFDIERERTQYERMQYEAELEYNALDQEYSNED